MAYTNTPVAVWRSFLASGEEGEPPITLLKTANEEAKAAKEDARSKEEQLELMTAMLHAAEDELSLRSNQLELTNAMLKATEAELARKEEQLDITTQMLKKAEQDIGKGEHERRTLRQELATVRASLSGGARAVSGSSRAGIGGSSSSGGGCSGSGSNRRAELSGADSAAEIRRVAAAEAAAASRLAAELASVGQRTAGSGANFPTDLPEQQASSGRRPVKILLTHGDDGDAMRPKTTVRDNRQDALGYIESRGFNGRLPVTHTSMVLLDDGDPDENDDGTGVDGCYVRSTAASRPGPG